jgi:hypothetical protein
MVAFIFRMSRLSDACIGNLRCLVVVIDNGSSSNYLKAKTTTAGLFSEPAAGRLDWRSGWYEKQFTPESRVNLSPVLVFQVVMIPIETESALTFELSPDL